MSWNKNTVVRSSIDNVKATLDTVGVPYELTTLGEVDGNGLNDVYGVTKYPIRKLTFNGSVIREIMQRHPDCDIDDVIDYTEDPDAPLEITLQVEGYNC